MRVRMLTIAAGPGLTADVGQVVEVSEKQGAELIAGRFAVAAQAAQLPAALETAEEPRHDVEDTTSADAGRPHAGRRGPRGRPVRRKRR